MGRASERACVRGLPPHARAARRPRKYGLLAVVAYCRRFLLLNRAGRRRRRRRISEIHGDWLNSPTKVAPYPSLFLLTLFSRASFAAPHLEPAGSVYKNGRGPFRARAVRLLAEARGRFQERLARLVPFFIYHAVLFLFCFFSVVVAIVVVFLFFFSFFFDWKK